MHDRDVRDVATQTAARGFVANLLSQRIKYECGGSSEEALSLPGRRNIPLRQW